MFEKFFDNISRSINASNDLLLGYKLETFNNQWEKSNSLIFPLFIDLRQWYTDEQASAMDESQSIRAPGWDEEDAVHVPLQNSGGLHEEGRDNERLPKQALSRPDRPRVSGNRAQQKIPAGKEASQRANAPCPRDCGTWRTVRPPIKVKVLACNCWYAGSLTRFVALSFDTDKFGLNCAKRIHATVAVNWRGKKVARNARIFLRPHFFLGIFCSDD